MSILLNTTYQSPGNSFWKANEESDYVVKFENQSLVPAIENPATGFTSDFYNLSLSFTVPKTGLYAIQTSIYVNELQSLRSGFGDFVQFYALTAPYDPSLVVKGSCIPVMPVSGATTSLTSVGYGKFFAGVTYNLYCSLNNETTKFNVLNDGTIKYNYYLVPV